MKYYELAIKSLHERLEFMEKQYEYLQKRVEYLEDENIGLTNELYEVQNRLDMMLDSCYSLNDFQLGD